MYISYEALARSSVQRPLSQFFKIMFPGFFLSGNPSVLSEKASVALSAYHFIPGTIKFKLQFKDQTG